MSAVTRLIALSVLCHSPSSLIPSLRAPFLVTPALPARHVASPLNFLTLFAVAVGRGALPLALGLTDALEMTRYVYDLEGCSREHCPGSKNSLIHDLTSLPAI